ncbi:MAG: hypothetical protein IJZ51_09055, partial [Ruminiclostridium sp.]|nr:hypothetical protein [Ruminiclostridium sp.]
MFKRITAFITAAALSIQCLCSGGLPFGGPATTAGAEELSSLYIDATEDSDYIAGLDVSISDTSNKNSFILNVSATPIGFEGYSPDDPIMDFYHRLVDTYLTAYLVDGEMPDPQSLTQDELREIMNKAKDAITSDPVLSAAPRFMTYTFSMPKKAAVTNEDDTEGTPADVYINCVSGKSIPYVGTDIRMGDYSIVDKGDSYEITIALDNYSLWANPDIFNFAVGMNINAADTEIKDVILGKDGDVIEIDAYVVPPAPPEDANDIANNFSVSKQSSSNNEDGTITYTIVAKSYNGATLAGKTITDLGPDNLSQFELVSAKKGDNNVPMTGDALIYTFPDDSTETEAEFKITYKLDDGFLGNYIQSNGFYIGTHNKVTLTDDDNPEINKPADAWGNISHSFMNKQGQLANNDNKKVDWTITIDTKYVCADNIYLVDYLNNTQTYVADSLTVNGVPATLGSAEAIGDSLASLVVNPDGTVSVATDTVLTYGTGDDKTEGFVIKLSDFGNPADLTQGEKIIIKYSTELRDDIDAEAYASENYGFMKYKNTSELIADNIWYGEDDKSSATDYDGEIKREHEISTSVKAFEKSTGDYRPYTQIHHWKLTVNPQFGMSCDKAVITDVLPEGFIFTDGDILTGKITKSDSTSTEITFTRVDGTAPENGLVEEYKYYIDGDKITIGLGEVKADEKYELSLKTKVASGKLFTTVNNWSGSISFTNNAALHTLYDTLWTSQTASATTWLGADTFKKEAISNYDVENKTASWKITANISCLPIEGLKLTEVLPDGMKLLSIDKIEIRDLTCMDEWGNHIGSPLASLTPAAGDTSCESTASGDSISWTITDTPGALYGGETVVFSFNGAGISDNKYEIYITTVATDEVIAEKLGKGTDYYFENSCTIEGEIYDEPLSFTNTAKVNANYSRTDKKGEIVAGMEDTIMWTCTFNKDKVDMGEVWLVDDLASVGLELILDSKLFELTIKADGATLSEEEFNKFEPELNLTDFSIKIPEDYKDKTLTITFYTRIVEDRDFITNKLYIKQDGTQDKEEHSSSNAVDTSDYDFSAGASTSPNPKIIINKYDMVTGHILPGVKFKATYTYKGRELSKSATSNANGIAYLTNLPKDVIITFTEESTADGYVLYPKKYKVVFLAETSAENYSNDIHCIDTNTSTKPKFEVDIKNRPEGEPAISEEIIIFKTFADTDLGSLSSTEANALLDNTEFTIYSDEECTDEVDSATLKWDSERKQAYVCFEGLTVVDTYYYIKETKAPAGFKTSSTVFEVFVDEHGIVSYEDEGVFVDQRPVCENEKVVVDKITAIKLYQNTDLSALSENSRNDIIQRTKFNLFTDALCTQKVFDSGISPVWDSVSNTASITISSGIEIGKTYYLKETDSPSIYKLSDEIFKIVVNDDGTISYFDENGTEINAIYFENQLKQIGPITLEKVYGDTNLSTMDEADRNEILNGTVFTLYGNGELTMIIDTASPEWVGDKAVVSFTESLAPDYIYYLLETSAPDGYVKSEKLYKCVIDEDGNVSYFDGNTALDEIVCVNEKETPETTPAPETTTPVPETTTPVPETTPAPETTTPVPETTPAPETTTPV